MPKQTHRTRIVEWLSEDRTRYNAQARCSCRWTSSTTMCMNRDSKDGEIAQGLVYKTAQDYAALHKKETRDVRVRS